jgi:hypothetical protein
LIASLNECGAQDIKVSNLPIDVGYARRKQLVHVMAGCVAGVADVDDLADWARVRPAARPRRMKSSRDKASGP